MVNAKGGSKKVRPTKKCFWEKNVTSSFKKVISQIRSSKISMTMGRGKQWPE